MVEVTKETFPRHFPEIQESILVSDFIALDAEFTGLKIGSSNRISMFDNEEDRFRKIHRGSIDTLIVQLGISVFRYDPSMMGYRAKSWTFHVFPDSFGSLDFPFACSGASLKFLAQNNFDFNKCFYHGIPYLNDSEVKCFQNDIQGSNWMLNLTPNEEDELEDIRLRLSESSLERIVIECKFISPYIVQIDVQQRFKHLWSNITERDPQSIEIYRVDQETRNSLVAKSKGIGGIKDKFLSQFIGLSEVIRVLRKAKKPIVGHNFLLDLAKIYHQFINPLSPCYKTFKEKVKEEFPIVFDTKYMVGALKKELASHDLKNLSRLLFKSKLSSLYEQLEGNLYKFQIFFEPIIKNDSEFDGRNRSQSKFHVAGYDSLITGKIFLYLCHISSAIPFYKWNYLTPLNFSGHLKSVKKYQNKLFASTSSFACFDLENDEVFNLLMLYVTVRDSSITTNKLSNMFCQYGRVETRHHLSKQFILACSKDATFRRILKDHSDSQDIQIVPYNDMIHSKFWRTVQGIFSLSLGSTIGVCVYFMFS